MKKMSFFNRFVFSVNVFVSLLLLLACVVPFISIASFSFLSLMVPLLVILNLLFFMYWLLKRRSALSISAVVLIVGYFILGSFVEFRSENISNKTSDLSILSFNSMGFGGYEIRDRKKTTAEIKIFVNAESPDVLCFQEFDWRQKKDSQFSEYRHRYFHGLHDQSRVTQAIFSKFPIVGKGSLQFPESFNNGIFADIMVKEDTIRIYNLHLESLKVRPGMLKREKSDRLFKRLRYSFSKQKEQADIFAKHAEKSPYKIIVCGDFNNTQFSNVYRTIKGDMKDTFSEKGSGYGKTINFWRFPLRIDFILTDPEFEVLFHKNFELGLSDHEPVMASVKLSSN